MVQPVTYGNVSLPLPNLGAAFAEAGMAIGDAIRAKQLAEEADMYKRELKQAMDSGDPQAFARLAAKYPNQAQSIKSSFGLLSAEQQQAELLAGAEAYNAIQSGNITAAKTLIDNRILAAANAGKDTSRLEAIKRSLDADPSMVAKNLDMVMYSVLPEQWSKATSRTLERRKLEAEVAKLEQEANSPGGLSGEKKVAVAKDLRKEYSDQTKNFKDVRDAYDRIKASEETAAGDLALIFNYMKMLDPGSVVREGEFANAQNAAGVPTRIQNLYNNLLTGQRLNPDQRKSFTSQAEKLFIPMKKNEERVREGIKRIGNKLGIPDEDLFYSSNSQVQKPLPPSLSRFSKYLNQGTP